MSTGLTLWCLSPKRRKLRHGPFEISVPETMPVGFEMRWCPTEVNVLVAFKRKNGGYALSGTKALNSCSYALASVLHFTFINKMHLANVFVTAEQMNSVRKMARVCGAFQYARE